MRLPLPCKRGGVGLSAGLSAPRSRRLPPRPGATLGERYASCMFRSGHGGNPGDVLLPAGRLLVVLLTLTCLTGTAFLMMLVRLALGEGPMSKETGE